MKFTTHVKETRRNITVDCSSPLITDQSSKKMCDINNIMKTYEKTGMLPNLKQKIPRYIDNTLIPSLEEAFRITESAFSDFQKLPAIVRKLMDNDPSKMENFIADPANKEILLKHGILIERKAQEIPKPSDTPTPHKKELSNGQSKSTNSDNSSTTV